MKDGRPHLAYKAEQAVDLECGSILGVTVHGGAKGTPSRSWRRWRRPLSRWSRPSGTRRRSRRWLRTRGTTATTSLLPSTSWSFAATWSCPGFVDGL